MGTEAWRTSSPERFTKQEGVQRYFDGKAGNRHDIGLPLVLGPRDQVSLPAVPDGAAFEAIQRFTARARTGDRIIHL